MTKNTKLFFLDQHGCAKNQVDGELIISYLAKDGWCRTDSSDFADLIIVNSCGFIEDAKKESLDSLFVARKSYPEKKIILAGCLAERYSDVFAENLTEADGIFGNGDISKINEIVNAVFENDGTSAKKPVVKPEQKGVSCCPRCELLNFPGSAWVKITEGCDNLCSFCAIPLIRGNLRSRAINEIISEIQSLLAKGIFEFNLIGQDLASYGRAKGEGKDFGNENGFFITRGASGSANSPNNADKSPLSVLLREITKLKGDFWVRLLYIHPDNFPLDIFDIVKNDERILPYFDIPFQSGDDNIIKAMNRNCTAQQYLELVRTIRTECEKSPYKDSCIRTTFLCGFPGETDEAHKNSEVFLQEMQCDWAGCFAYSREDGTNAFSMKKQNSKKTSLSRIKNLNQIQENITKKRLQRHIGKVLRVLIEEIVKDKNQKEGIAIGRAWFQSPDVDGNVVINYDIEDENVCAKIIPGKTVNVKINGVSGVDLWGAI